MTRDDVAEVAGRTARQVFGGQNVEEIVVREDKDLDDDPSLFIEVFLTPDAWRVEPGASLGMSQSIRDRLLAGGERRFAYIRLRDRAGEEEDEIPAAD